MELGDEKDFTLNAKFLRFGATIRAIEQSIAATRVYRPLPLCAFCDQLTGMVRYTATDGKRVHRHCLGRYEAAITAISHSFEEIPMRYYLQGGKYVLKCDGCPTEKHLTCNQADIRKNAEADSWEQIGNRFLCPKCALSTRRALYRATNFTR